MEWLIQAKPGFKGPGLQILYQAQSGKPWYVTNSLQFGIAIKYRTKEFYKSRIIHNFMVTINIKSNQWEIPKGLCLSVWQQNNIQKKKKKNNYLL